MIAGAVLIDNKKIDLAKVKEKYALIVNDLIEKSFKSIGFEISFI